MPEASVASFAGVANHWQHGPISQARSCSTSAAGPAPTCSSRRRWSGPTGRAIGIDMTPSMLDRARASAPSDGLTNVELHESLIESLPLEDESVDVVISNGVIDLCPTRTPVFAEIDRVLRPGGRLQIADVFIRHEVSEDARKRIDLWTG